MAWLGEGLSEQEQDGRAPFAPRCVKDVVEERLFRCSRIGATCSRDSTWCSWTPPVCSSRAPEGVRRIIYTTNAIEALNSKLRRAVRTRGHFPSDDAATKLLYLVLNHAVADWKRPAARVGRGEDAIRRHVQRALRARMMETASHRNPDSPSCRGESVPSTRRPVQ